MAKNKEEKNQKQNGSGHHYTAESITVLEGLEPVRKRPGMYIGTTGPDGLHHLITEIFDNSRDEAMGGFANDIEIALLPGNRVRVVDNGRGIPVDVHKQTKVSALETIMTTLHAGGKFGGEGYKVSGGLHGVGASVVNALSVFMEVIVHRDDGVFYQEYKQGKAKARVKKIGKSDAHGTIVLFEPDTEIFKEIKFDFDRVVNHMRQQAYLVRGMRVSVIDARAVSDNIDLGDVFYLRDLGLEVPSQTFYFEGGLVSLVKHYNEHYKPIHKNIFYVEKKVEGVESVEVALQYVDDISSRVMPFANNIHTPEGGTHITGFKTALTRTLNTYARASGLLKESEENFTGEDVLEGLTAIISVKLREIQFEGQTKAKLGSVEAQSAVATVFGEAFASFFEENPDDARAIVNKVILALKARKAAKAAKDSVLRKGALEGMTLPGKLADCETKSAEEAELFIVEGDSAGGCFHGDTLVALADGRHLSFKNLVKEYEEGRKNYCYTIDERGSVQIQEIKNPRVTKKNATVVKVILDNEEEILCTPDHRFMLRDGNFKEARSLTSHDSLMPLRRQISKLGKRITIKGYELVWSPGEHRWIFTHLVSDRFNLGKGVYKKEENQAIHHKDFNKRNNNPHNLVRMDRMEHFFFHTQNLEKTIHSEEVKERCRQLKKTKAFRSMMSRRMSEPKMQALLSRRAKKQWENENYKEYMTKKFLEFYKSNEEYRRKNRVLLDHEQKKYWATDEHRKNQAKKVAEYFRNHPEKREYLRQSALQEWKNADLLSWRSEATQKQWTADFRKKRKEAYSRTYLDRALRTLHDLSIQGEEVTAESYDRVRRETNNKTLLKWETILDRFFGGDKERLQEAVAHYNHRILRIERVTEKVDVYDIEVPGTHNFALASGVFVHNSGKQGRDRRIQAILPLRGKVLNVERARLDKILGFAEIKALVIALGTGIADSFDVSKLRYHKVIIATDADVDGAHIRTLLLTLFYRYFRALIEGGFIYIAQPPLYRIKRGKEVAYFYSEETKNVYLKKEGIEVKEVNEIEGEGGGDEGGEAGEEKETKGEESKTSKEPKKAKVSIQRYKGLGEMNPEELWETTMDPSKRVLKQVHVEDAQEADKVFDILMGEDVPSRKSFIQSNATKATLDI